jgi:ABC-type transport system involved in multi-copper enzyme maturation permease subunit
MYQGGPPAFAGALALAILPVWLVPSHPWNSGVFPPFLFFVGTVMLALSSFGREIGLKTLPFILAQPVERTRIWWTKIAVLAVFVSLSYDAWCLSRSLYSLLRPALWLPPEDPASFGLFVVVFTAGGLWMTLWLRQTVAAFWLTLLIPIATIIAIGAVGGADWMGYTALGLYAVAGFFLAKRQFLRMQDTAWTGGVLSFSRAPAEADRCALRAHRPWAALFRKELQLQQVTLLGIGCLLALHLGVVALRKAGADVFSKTTLSALEMFGVVWLFVPLLAGSQSVADERQLGTLDGLLCLPVSRRVQFGVKLLFVLVLGGLLSAGLLCAVEDAGSAMGVGANLGVMGITFAGRGLIPVFLVFLALSLLGFYASTLTRGVVQALAAGAVAALVFWFIHISATHTPQAVEAFGWRLWPVMAYPALTAAILWLAYGNFRHIFEGGRRWRWNILGLIAVLAVVCGSAAALYHRVWELAMPLEGARGPARLSAGKPVLLRSTVSSGLAIVLPDGRLWEDRVAHDREGVWSSLGGHHFVPGSNWVDAYANFRETVAIRTDGTLWVSEKPRRPWIGEGPPPPEDSPPLVQFGAETDWLSLGRGILSPVVLLKRDGTLWSWGTNYYTTNFNPTLRAFAPLRLGPDSDWARILWGVNRLYAWKRDGQAWALRESEFTKEEALKRQEVEIAPGVVAERVPGLDHVQFQSLTLRPTGLNSEAGVRDDGTLWCMELGLDQYAQRQAVLLQANGLAGTGPGGIVQIGKDSNWVAVASGFIQYAALKADGSIWRWNLDPQARGFQGMAKDMQEAPVRLGTHDDWVSLGCCRGEIVALAADGTLWCWPPHYPSVRYYVSDELWLAPSRRPAKIENILGAPE